MNSRKPRNISPFKIGAFAVLILLLGLTAWFALGKNRQTEDEFLAPVITLYPQLGTIEKTIGLSSRVETGRLITLVPRVAGTLIRLDADPGRALNRDDMVAQVDPAPYNQTYLQAQAAFLTARSTFERVNNLYAGEAATRQQFEEARTAFEAARAQYELARLNLDYATIRSPIAGVVLTRHSTEGGTVAAGTPLATLGDLEDLRIKAAVPEIHYRFFAGHWEDMPARVRVPALGDEEFPLRPLNLAPYVSPENRSFLVEYAIPNAAVRGLRPGMFVNVSFVLESREDVYRLPLRIMGSQNRLWYVDGEGRAQFIEFVPEFFNDEFFQIPGEHGSTQFILEGQHFISPGQKLNILNAAQPDGAGGP
ncbi:MAG: efflux RND transporter periplasmic adaptor subunit [Treponema sp.]|jgi:RND family efflux transporter MFP subunit|nr:efflux RND transporter periplasmic adaptor subunit [Treponema sp.]